MNRHKERIPYALSLLTGEPIYIDDIPVLDENRGFKLQYNYPCVCPFCKQLLKSSLPNKSPSYTKRFSHQSGNNCSGSFESGIHLKAKDIIQKNGLFLKPLVLTESKTVKSKEYTHSKTVFAGGHFTFDKVELEKRYYYNGKHYIIPDITAYLNGHPIFIEIYVTHEVDRKKQAILKSIDIPSIEINLTDVLYLRLDKDLEELFANHDAISMRETWLHHPNIQITLEELLSLVDKSIEDDNVLFNLTRDQMNAKSDFSLEKLDELSEIYNSLKHTLNQKIEKTNNDKIIGYDVNRQKSFVDELTREKWSDVDYEREKLLSKSVSNDNKRTKNGLKLFLSPYKSPNFKLIAYKHWSKNLELHSDYSVFMDDCSKNLIPDYALLYMDAFFVNIPPQLWQWYIYKEYIEGNKHQDILVKNIYNELFGKGGIFEENVFDDLRYHKAIYQDPNDYVLDAPSAIYMYLMHLRDMDVLSFSTGVQSICYVDQSYHQAFTVL